MKKNTLLLIALFVLSILIGFSISAFFINNTGSETFIDTDADMVADDEDAFPNDPAASVDSDGDGYPDRWNPGKSQKDSTSSPPLELDEVPFDPDEHKDSDGDGVGDNKDVFPDDPNEWSDLDSDGYGDNSDKNPYVDLKIDIKLDKFLVTKRVDILKWAQVYFDLNINRENERINNNGKRWWVKLNKETKIQHDLISYDIPDDTKDDFTTIEIIMYDYNLFVKDEVIDISTELGNSLQIKYDHVSNTVSTNDFSEGTGGKLWYKITLGTEECPDEKTYTITYKWNFRNKLWTLTSDIPINTYMNYKNSNVDRQPQNQSHTNDAMAAFVTSNEKVVVDLTNELLAIAESQNYNEVTTANFILRFVQENIEYTPDDVTKGRVEYWRFPVETLVDKQGDCEDSSVLFAAIMDALDYDVALLFYSWLDDDSQRVGHLAVGLHLSGNHGSYVQDSEGKIYFYCETTNTPFTIGKLPPEIKVEPKKVIPI